VRRVVELLQPFSTPAVGESRSIEQIAGSEMRPRADSPIASWSPLHTAFELDSFRPLFLPWGEKSALLSNADCRAIERPEGGMDGSTIMFGALWILSVQSKGAFSLSRPPCVCTHTNLLSFCLSCSPQRPLHLRVRGYLMALVPINCATNLCPLQKYMHKNMLKRAGPQGLPHSLAAWEIHAPCPRKQQNQKQMQRNAGQQCRPPNLTPSISEAMLAPSRRYSFAPLWASRIPRRTRRPPHRPSLRCR
jgi:hypothetical protein